MTGQFLKGDARTNGALVFLEWPALQSSIRSKEGACLHNHGHFRHLLVRCKCAFARMRDPARARACKPISVRRYSICRKGGPSVEWNVTGKYEIIEFLGEGSYGQVCRARLVAPESPDCPQTVVIKRIIDVFHVSLDLPCEI